jgi:hypothetical protein
MAKDPRARPPTMDTYSEQIAALLPTLPADARGAARPAGAPGIGSLPTAATGFSPATAPPGYASPPAFTPSPHAFSPQAPYAPQAVAAPPSQGYSAPPAAPPGVSPRPAGSAAPSRRTVALVVTGMIILGGGIAALIIADHARGHAPAPGTGPGPDPAPSDAAVVRHDAPASEPPHTPSNDPWAGGVPGDAGPAMPDQWGGSGEPEGQKLPVGQGVSIIVPSSFRHGEQADILVAMDTRGVMIAAGPIALSTNDPQKLAQAHARAYHLTYESMSQIFIGGVQRPMAIFHGTVNGVIVRHVAVPLIGKGYRVAVVFQFPAQLATDPSIQGLGIDLFTRRIVLP